jgi:hypothetical protein
VGGAGWRGCDSAVLERLMCGEDGGVAIPPSLRQKSLVNKKGRYIANKRNKGTVCALPSIHLTFGKGGKCDGAEQGDYCPFTMIAGMARVDATGGASPSPYEKREG